MKQNPFRMLLLTCRDVTRLQSDSLDRSLSFSAWLGMRLHLLICRWCRRYGKQLRFLRTVVHEHDEEITENMPQSLTPEARERLKAKLRP